MLRAIKYLEVVEIFHGMDAPAGGGNRKGYPENLGAAVVITGLGCSAAGGRSMGGGEEDVGVYSRGGSRYLQRHAFVRSVTLIEMRWRRGTAGLWKR